MAQGLSSLSTRTWPERPAGRIGLLDVDPDLAGSVSEAEIAAARHELTVPVYRLQAGPMPLPEAAPDNRVGYVVLKGLLMYEVSVCGRATAELLGVGDVIRPWKREDAMSLGSEFKWTVLEQALLADAGVAISPRLSNGREIVSALMARFADRTDRVAVQRSIASHVRVDVRVLGYLWHLADRFGVVQPGRVRLDVPLTHAVLARLIGARRPTVTTALQRLIQLGYLRRDGRAFVLLGDASAVEELDSRSPARDFALPDGVSDAVPDDASDADALSAVAS